MTASVSAIEVYIRDPASVMMPCAAYAAPICSMSSLRAFFSLSSLTGLCMSSSITPLDSRWTIEPWL